MDARIKLTSIRVFWVQNPAGGSQQGGAGAGDGVDEGAPLHPGLPRGALPQRPALQEHHPQRERRYAPRSSLHLRVFEEKKFEFKPFSHLTMHVYNVRSVSYVPKMGAFPSMICQVEAGRRSTWFDMEQKYNISYNKRPEDSRRLKQ